MIAVKKRKQMNSKVNYSIHPDDELVLERCKGQVTVTDVIRMKKAETAEKCYDPVYNVIADLRDFDTCICSANIHKINDFVEFLKKLGAKGRVALLTSRPNHVVISVVLGRLAEKALATKYGVFSTLEAAIRFVGYGCEKIDEIDKKINELNIPAAQGITVGK
jgi:hypothetical protein